MIQVSKDEEKKKIYSLLGVRSKPTSSIMWILKNIFFLPTRNQVVYYQKILHEIELNGSIWKKISATVYMTRFKPSM